jgi:hypothetical protein
MREAFPRWKTRFANLTEPTISQKSQKVALFNPTSGNRERDQNKQGDCKTQFPLVIAEWDRNSREVVRVALDRYNGRPTINARVWYHDGDTLKPSKSGITLALKHLPALADALARSLDAARDLGLLDEGSEQ